ncbi:EamA family transporter [Zhengella mangrovi]|uniref:EamA family transporter n=1 Tax=Zhengella mangrovi TaxID=1982044 RepID=A0A2G1QJ75_9HYPH|nr:DMT family transporter [Zhengella mangrovi]PHP65562.1 EamA family transporter [Zhengella mangrovi]
MTPTRLAPPLFVALWATGFIGARYAMPYAEPFTFLGIRFVISAALIAGLVLWFAGPRLKPSHIYNSMIAGMLMHGVYLGGVFWAIRHGMPAGLSALIIGLQPLVTAFMAVPALGERVTLRHWTGLVVGFAGVAIVLWPKIGVIGAGVNGATLTASIISVLGMSAGTIWQKRFVQGANLLRGTFWQYLGGVIAALPMVLFFETGQVVVNGSTIFAMAWLVLVLSIGAIMLLMYLIREGAISKVASLFYLVPACTAVFAWILFDEELLPIQIAGMAVTSFGVALATMANQKPAPAARGNA